MTTPKQDTKACKVPTSWGWRISLLIHILKSVLFKSIWNP